LVWLGGVFLLVVCGGGGGVCVRMCFGVRFWCALGVHMCVGSKCLKFRRNVSVEMSQMSKDIFDTHTHTSARKYPRTHTDTKQYQHTYTHQHIFSLSRSQHPFPAFFFSLSPRPFFSRFISLTYFPLESDYLGHILADSLTQPSAHRAAFLFRDLLIECRASLKEYSYLQREIVIERARSQKPNPLPPGGVSLRAGFDFRRQE